MLFRLAGNFWVSFGCLSPEVLVGLQFSFKTEHVYDVPPQSWSVILGCEDNGDMLWWCCSIV